MSAVEPQRPPTRQGGEPSYARGSVELPLLDATIGATLGRTVEAFPGRDVLVAPEQGFRATYAELWELVGLAARGLLARGIESGDRVGIWSPNRFEWFVTQFAAARVGAILVNVNPAYKTTELEHALRKVGVKLLVHSRGFRETDYVGMLDEVRESCPALEPALVHVRASHPARPASGPASRALVPPKEVR